MNKKTLLRNVIKLLRKDLNALAEAAIETKNSATHEDAKPENKYDTHGLELSYLAGAQAKRVEKLKETIYSLETIPIQNYKDLNKIVSTILIQVRVNDEDERWLLMLPAGAGLKLMYEGREIQIITPDSPIGLMTAKSLIGDSFELDIKGKLSEYEVISAI